MKRVCPHDPRNTTRRLTPGRSLDRTRLPKNSFFFHPIILFFFFWFSQTHLIWEYSIEAQVQGASFRCYWLTVIVVCTVTVVAVALAGFQDYWCCVRTALLILRLPVASVILRTHLNLTRLIDEVFSWIRPQPLDHKDRIIITIIFFNGPPYCCHDRGPRRCSPLLCTCRNDGNRYS